MTAEELMNILTDREQRIFKEYRETEERAKALNTEWYAIYQAIGELKSKMAAEQRKEAENGEEVEE